MILCATEDLLFSITISSAAKRLGVDLYFERRPGRVVASVQERQPTMAILDLNSPRLNPLAVIADIKSDPSLAGVSLLGYVSHVDSDTIAKARAAGIDDVLARSAFVAQLGQILERGSAR